MCICPSPVENMPGYGLVSWRYVMNCTCTRPNTTVNLPIHRTHILTDMGLVSGSWHSICRFQQIRFRAGYCLPILHHQFHATKATMSPLKRKAENETTVNAKKARIVVPDYHLASPRRDESGEIVWPAPAAQIDRARDIIREWYAPSLSYFHL